MTCASIGVPNIPLSWNYSDHRLRDGNEGDEERSYFVECWLGAHKGAFTDGRIYYYIGKSNDRAYIFRTLHSARQNKIGLYKGEGAGAFACFIGNSDFFRHKK